MASLFNKANPGTSGSNPGVDKPFNGGVIHSAPSQRIPRGHSMPRAQSLDTQDVPSSGTRAWFTQPGLPISRSLDQSSRPGDLMSRSGETTMQKCGTWDQSHFNSSGSTSRQATGTDLNSGSPSRNTVLTSIGLGFSSGSPVKLNESKFSALKEANVISSSGITHGSPSRQAGSAFKGTPPSSPARLSSDRPCVLGSQSASAPSLTLASMGPSSPARLLSSKPIEIINHGSPVRKACIRPCVLNEKSIYNSDTPPSSPLYNSINTTPKKKRGFSSFTKKLFRTQSSQSQMSDSSFATGKLDLP